MSAIYLIHKNQVQNVEEIEDAEYADEAEYAEEACLDHCFSRAGNVSTQVRLKHLAWSALSSKVFYLI